MTKTSLPPTGFQGLKVVTLESRQADIICQHIARFGGIPISAPSMQEIPLENNPEAFHFAEKLLAGKIDMVIFMTGVGARFLFDVMAKRHSLTDIGAALSKTCVVARGPKSVQVLREFKIPVTITVPEPNTWREILETLDYSEKGITLKGKSVAIQEYGEDNPDFIAGLKKRGANIIRVPVYRWALPPDTAPLLEAIREIAEGNVQVLMVTSANQIRNMIRLASEHGLEENFRKGSKQIVIASIGPTATAAIQESGLSVDFEPSHPKMGHLVSEMAQNIHEIIEAKRQPTPHIRLTSAPAIVDLSERALRRQSPFMKACFREPVPYTPVWLMRQAGRYMKEYNAIRSKVPFLELCKRSDLAAEVTIQAVEKIKADAAIIFSDILVALEPMGLGLEYLSGDGPMISGEIHNISDVQKLHEMNPGESLSFVYDAIRLTRANLKKNIPLIGFCGAPFTLAAYAIEGGGSKNFLKTKQFMYQEEKAWHLLMEKISRGLTVYLKKQVEAGADALQVFDSWVGCLSPEDYKHYVMPHTQSILKEISPDIPVIHFGTNTAGFLDLIREAGGQVTGVDYRVDLDRAWKLIGHDQAIQGNLDPAVLLAPLPIIRKNVEKIIKQSEQRTGYIFNLGHGILPTTPVDHVISLIEMVHELSAR
ncbi:MAG: uroporphyrinogen decarboxylase [Candidatus Omnitrophica bacterium]|nr:uroporphyrinogen decarboxylase [Candidatus Omnitrophota bacterium]